MNLFDFYMWFPDETSCQEHLKKVRDQQGVQCKKCGSIDHYWLAPKQQYRCKQCRFRTTLTSGTIMQSSKLPLRYWFMAIHLITSTKKSFSALEAQYQIGHQRYEPIWAMMHKIRMAMGKRNERYKLKGMVEADEGFFRAAEFNLREEEENEEEEEKSRKRGRGSKGNAKVLVLASVKPSNENRKNKPDTSLRYVKMLVVDDLTANTIDKTANDEIDDQSQVKTDGYKGYNNFKNILKEHIMRVVPSDLLDTHLPWVHKIISNAKRLLLGINHSTSMSYIQNYLNEFCYKLNRRYMRKKMFERAMIASVSDPWY